MKGTLSRLFRYNEWANREALKSLADRKAAAPPRSVQLLAHIVAAEWLWLERIQNIGQSHAVWPEWAVDEIEPQMARASQAWRIFLNGCDESALTREFEYTNTKGEHYRNTVGDAAMHVAMHGAYHRGQIAVLARQNGVQPAYTDYIQAVRAGEVG